MGTTAETRIPSFRCSALAAGLLLLLAGCGGGGGVTPLTQHQEGSLFRSGDTYNFSGPGASDTASREALQYTLNGVVYYLVDYRSRQVSEGGFYVSSSWNGQLDGNADSARPPDGQIAISGDNARAVIELGGGPTRRGLRLTGEFSVASCNSVAAQARAVMMPSTFPGMNPAATFLLGRASTPLIVRWHAEGFYGDTPVDITAQQTLSCESYDYTLETGEL